MSNTELFSLRQMIDLTGLSEFTLRGWENRYLVFSPKRTGTGRRLYSKTDVERALLLRELLKRGHRIGKIADLSNKKLQDLFEEDGTNTTPTVHQRARSKDVESILQMVALQKWEELDRFFLTLKWKSGEDLIKNLLLPLIEEFNIQISEGLVSVAQEHVVSSLIKETIYRALNSFSPPNQNKKTRFILATPEGDLHELGILMGHLLIRSKGFHSLYLGPNTPGKELTETALRFEATHVLIASTVSKRWGARQEFLTFLNFIMANLSPKAKVLIAGNQTNSHLSESKKTITSLYNFDDLINYLEKIQNRKTKS